MDFKDYDKIYQDLLKEKGRIDIANDGAEKEKLVNKVNEFLELYPKSIPKDKDPNARFYQLSLKEIIKRFIQTAVDILNDIAELLSRKEYIGNDTFRRSLFTIVTKEERRFYVGMWLIFLSFVLYFIDSAA